MCFEIGAKIGLGECKIAVAVDLAKRQQLRGPAFYRHIGMDHCALEGEYGRQVMHMRGIVGGHIARLKPEVIIAVGALCCATGAHQINLCCHLIVGPKPSLAGGTDGQVSEILCKDQRIILA